MTTVFVLSLSLTWTTVDDLVIPFLIVLYLLVPDQFQMFNKPKPHCHHTQIYGG
jgi:hypothetical protein